MKRTSRSHGHVVGSGNVFRDLRVPNPDEELTKSALVFELCQAIRGRGLRQIEAAQLLGIPQPKVSNLLRGRTAGFSVQRLSMLLARLGRGVTIVVSDLPHRPGLPRIPVVRDSAGLVTRMAQEWFAVDGRRATEYSATTRHATRAARTAPARRSAQARPRRRR